VAPDAAAANPAHFFCFYGAPKNFSRTAWQEKKITTNFGGA
jgi:hypothetical protein